MYFYHILTTRLSGSVIYSVALCLSVCLSVTSHSSINMAE